MFIVVSKVRALAKAQGKRVSRGFLSELDLIVAEKVERACKIHNGGAKTLDRVVAQVVFGKIK